MITPEKMITPENDHVETISIDPKDDIKIEINDNDENNPNGTEEIFATDQDINNGQQISGFTMNLGPMNQGIRFVIESIVFFTACLIILRLFDFIKDTPLMMSLPK